MLLSLLLLISLLSFGPCSARVLPLLTSPLLLTYMLLASSFRWSPYWLSSYCWRPCYCWRPLCCCIGCCRPWLLLQLRLYCYRRPSSCWHPCCCGGHAVVGIRCCPPSIIAVTAVAGKLVSCLSAWWALFLWACTYHACTHIGLSVLLPDIIVTSLNILILREKIKKFLCEPLPKLRGLRLPVTSNKQSLFCIRAIGEG